MAKFKSYSKTWLVLANVDRYCRRTGRERILDANETHDDFVISKQISEVSIFTQKVNAHIIQQIISEHNPREMKELVPILFNTVKNAIVAV